ncbi:MAG: hypothetical protein KDK48_06890 [Chlamydiia bacterium]|nr:hypothetical protein [Chlamydiia bacterium]
MKILVIGSGARERALAHALSKDHEVVVTATTTPKEALRQAEAGKFDLTVVGPEAPLEAGIADLFAERGLKL